MLPETPEPKNGKRRVAICIPSLTGMFNHDLMVFLQEASKSNYLPDTPYQFRLHTVSGKSPVHLARNILADSAVTDESDLVWWLDDDTVPPRESFRMLPDFNACGADIMGAITPVMNAYDSGRKMAIKANGYSYNLRGNDMFTSIKPDLGSEPIIDVDACGMSATLMSIKVLTDPRMHLPRTYRWMDGTERTLPDTDQPVYFRTQEDPLGRITRSEDLDFCLRAKEAGYSVKYHLGVAFGHNKVTNLNGVLQAATDMAEANWEIFAEEARRKREAAA